jgi:hypothetical protein
MTNNTIDREHMIGSLLDRIAKMNGHYANAGLETINQFDFLKACERLSDEVLLAHYEGLQVLFDATDKGNK